MKKKIINVSIQGEGFLNPNFLDIFFRFNAKKPHLL